MSNNPSEEPKSTSFQIDIQSPKKRADDDYREKLAQELWWLADWIIKVVQNENIPGAVQIDLTSDLPVDIGRVNQAIVRALNGLGIPYSPDQLKIPSSENV